MLCTSTNFSEFIETVCDGKLPEGLRAARKQGTGLTKTPFAETHETFQMVITPLLTRLEGTDHGPVKCITNTINMIPKDYTDRVLHKSCDRDDRACYSCGRCNVRSPKNRGLKTQIACFYLAFILKVELKIETYM